jgi:hypothetical protein
MKFTLALLRFLSAVANLAAFVLGMVLAFRGEWAPATFFMVMCFGNTNYPRETK